MTLSSLHEPPGEKICEKKYIMSTKRGMTLSSSTNITMSNNEYHNIMSTKTGMTLSSIHEPPGWLCASCSFSSSAAVSRKFDTYVCVCVCVCVCVFVCLCVCVSVCIHIHIHTCIYIHSYVYIYIVCV